MRLSISKPESTFGKNSKLWQFIEGKRYYEILMILISIVTTFVILFG